MVYRPIWGGSGISSSPAEEERCGGAEEEQSKREAQLRECHLRGSKLLLELLCLNQGLYIKLGQLLGQVLCY